MTLHTSLNAFPACKIGICGEEEREQIPTFESWKGLNLNHLYDRCAQSADTKKKQAHDHSRRQPSEYYFTHGIDEVLKFMQHTRTDKVR